MDNGNGRQLNDSTELPDGAMRSYEHGPIEIKNDELITTGRMGYRYFEVEEVLRGGKPTGEYHIKLKVNSNMKSAVIFFRDWMPGFTVGSATPDEVIRLEFPIYAKAGKIAKMMLDQVPAIFEKIDEYLHLHRSGRKS